MTVRDVRAEDDRGALRNVVPAHGVVLERSPHQHEDGRVVPHGLEQDVLRVLEVRDVVDRRRPAAEHLVHLGLQLAPAVWVLREQVEGPGQCRRDGLVPGDEEPDHLVARLSIGDRRARLGVLRVQQQVDEVLGGVRRPPVLPDDAVDDAVERVERRVEAARGRKREPLRVDRRGQPPVRVTERVGDRRLDLVERLA